MMQLWQICWFNSSLANINFLFSIEISENLNESAPCSSWYTFYIEYLYKIMRAAFLFYFLSKINGVAASASLSFYMNIIYMCKSAPFLKRVGLHRPPFTLFQEREFVSSGRSNTTNTHTQAVFSPIYMYIKYHTPDAYELFYFVWLGACFPHTFRIIYDGVFSQSPRFLHLLFLFLLHPRLWLHAMINSKIIFHRI